MKERPLTDIFIHQLRDRMKFLKIRQTDLATLLGTSKQYVHCWFKKPRTRNPCGEVILRLQELMKKDFMKMLL